MTRQPVESTSIAAMAYDPAQAVLEVEFKRSGSVYRYFPVPASEYQALLNSPSKGSYFNQHIQKDYKYEKLS